MPMTRAPACSTETARPREAKVIELDKKVVYPEWSAESRIKHGYWQPYAGKSSFISDRELQGFDFRACLGEKYFG